MSSTIDYGPPVRNKERWFWGKRSGAWSDALKSFVFRQRQYSSGSNSSKGKPKSDARLLSENALALGWHNGERIGKRAAQQTAMKKKAN